MLWVHRLTVVLTAIGCFIAFLGAAIRHIHVDVFAWLLLYIPLLWAMWDACAFFHGREISLKRLLALWLFIDLTALLLFIAFAIRVENWANARGIEMAIFYAYFPAVMPTAFLINLVPENASQFASHLFDLLLKHFGGGAGDAFAIWLFMSGLAAVQSLGLTLISEYFFQKRMKKVQPVPQ